MTTSPPSSEIPLLPAALLVAGFPLLLLVLTELINSGRRRHWKITPTLRVLRGLVAPALAAMLFATHVWRLPADTFAARLVTTGFWISVLYAALSFVNDGVFGTAQPGSWQDRMPKLLRDLTRGILVAVGAALIYSHVWRQEITGALTALGVGGIVIGLALQEPLGNVVSGLMLLLERPLNTGDWIVADGTTGRVIEINWRSVHIETLLHEMRIIPNISLYKESFSNLSRPTLHRTETYDVGFSYDHPPNDVKRTLLTLMETTPGVVAEPPPEVHTVHYGDFSIAYRIYFTVARYEDVLPVRDAILTKIWYAARRDGLQIPFPVRVQHRPGEPTGPAPATPDELLERLPRYRVVRDALREAAGPSAGAGHPADGKSARIVPFATGEEMVAFDSAEHAFGLVVEGHAVLSARDASGREERIADLGPGDFYGVATIASGGRSEFRVVASSDVTALEFDAATMAEWLQRSSGLAAEVGTAIDARRRAAQVLRHPPVATPQLPVAQPAEPLGTEQRGFRT